MFISAIWVVRAEMLRSGAWRHVLAGCFLCPCHSVVTGPLASGGRGAGCNLIGSVLAASDLQPLVPLKSIMGCRRSFHSYPSSPVIGQQSWFHSRHFLKKSNTEKNSILHKFFHLGKYCDLSLWKLRHQSVCFS